MRITQIMLGKGFGGAERYFVDLTRALADRGHDVQAIVETRAEDSRRWLRDHAGVQVDPVSVLGKWDPIAPWRVQRLLTAFAPDVVHLHLARAARIGGHAAQRCGVASVATLHNYVKLREYRWVDVFQTITARQRQFVLDAGVAPERIQTIPNLSPLEAVTRPAVRDTGRHLVAFGRFVEKKGFDVLLDAFVRVADAVPGARLTLAGAGPLDAALKAQAQSLGIARAVTFPGWVDDVARLLDAADVFVLPSRLEPFGIVVIEAMARGVPIVATRTDGPLEILNEETAWLCDVDDVAALAQALIDALSSPSARQRRSERALERYRERYHRDAVLPQIEAFYAEARRLAVLAGQ